MSSREIAELIDKQHSHIKISAERLAEKGVIGTLATREFTHNGNIYTEYLLNKRDSLILVAQNCPEFTARIVDRWQELEAAVAAPILSTPEDPAVARLAALRAAGLLSQAGAEVASFRLLGLRPPPALLRAMEPTAVTAIPAFVQLELASPHKPAPARTPRAKPAPMPKVRLVPQKMAPEFDGLQFILSEAGEYVEGGEKALRSAMLARGFITDAGGPTPKGRALVSHKGIRGHHWRLGDLFRALGAIR